MKFDLALEKMAAGEKIAIMENIWADLSRNAEAVISPEWHNKILEEREELLDNGEAEFIDWEKAKKSIREKI